MQTGGIFRNNLLRLGLAACLAFCLVIAIGGGRVCRADALNTAMEQEVPWFSGAPSLDPDLAAYFERYGAAGPDSVCDASAEELAGLSLETRLLDDLAPEEQAALAAAGEASPDGQFNASTNYWWYFSTDHYNLLMPGTSAGPYSY